MLTRCLSILLVSTALAGCSQQETPADPIPQGPDSEALLSELTLKLDETTRRYMEEHHLPGAVIVLVRDGKTIFKRGYGLANVENGTAVDPDKTLFRIGSISKALTLLTLTRLADDGRVHLDDDVASYFEGIENPYSFEEPVRIRDLLTHTTGFDQIGIGRQIGDWDSSLEERKAARPGLSEFLRAGNLRRVSPPGQYFRYDTYGTSLAGAILEKVTGLPYAAAMKQELFNPVGMSDSFVEVDADRRDDLALGYGFVDGKYEPQPYEVYVTLPASSIDATAADMGRLLEVLTGGGASSKGRFFSQVTADAVLAPQFRPHPDFVGVTHGLRESYSGSRRPEVPVRSVEHGGDMLGYNAGLVIVPELSLGLFFATNRSGEAGGSHVRIGRPILETVIDTLYEGPGLELGPLPSPQPDLDLSEYLGDYYYGVFCHSCSSEEYHQGGWRRGNPQAVTASDGALMISEKLYLPQGGDVFVRSDGEKRVFFGRDSHGQVSFFVYSSSADTFERMDS